MNQDGNDSNLPEGGEPADSPESPEPVEKQEQDFFTRNRQQLAGFFGWFAVASLLAPFSFGLLTTPLTIIFLLAYGFSKKSKGVAGGILWAVGLNFVVALMRGLNLNAMCFIPFYFNFG